MAYVELATFMCITCFAFECTYDWPTFDVVSWLLLRGVGMDGDGKYKNFVTNSTKAWSTGMASTQMGILPAQYEGLQMSFFCSYNASHLV